jgi:hypothetical protein
VAETRSESTGQVRQMLRPHKQFCDTLELGRLPEVSQKRGKLRQQIRRNEINVSTKKKRKKIYLLMNNYDAKSFFGINQYDLIESIECYILSLVVSYAIERTRKPDLCLVLDMGHT